MDKLRSSGTLVGIGSRETLSSAGYYRDRVTKATWYAVSHYKPKPLPGSLLHVIASRRVIGPRTTDTRRMWEKLATGSAEVQLVDAPDSGQMFFSPHVESLAAHLRRYFYSG